MEPELFQANFQVAWTAVPRAGHVWDGCEKGCVPHAPSTGQPTGDSYCLKQALVPTLKRPPPPAVSESLGLGGRSDCPARDVDKFKQSHKARNTSQSPSASATL